MKIFVKAKAASKKEFVKKINRNHFVVSVRKPPTKGKANKAIVKALAGYFGKPASKIQIVSGLTCKQKIVEIY